MIGKFDQELKRDEADGVVIVGGPVRWDAPDEGKDVRIDARLEQNGNHDHCHMTVRAPVGATFPVFDRWEMPLQTNNIHAGPVDAHAFATSGGLILDQWDQPPELPTPVTVVVI